MNGHGIENHQQPISHILSHWGSHFRPGTRASARAASRAGTTASPTADQKQVLQRLKLFDYSKAIEYHTQDLAIAKEVGDRAGEGRAYGNLGSASVAGGL